MEAGATHFQAVAKTELAKANAVLAKANAVVNFSFKALWAMIMANPLIVLIAGLTAVITLVKYFNGLTLKSNNQLNEQLAKDVEVASKRLEENDQKRADADTDFERLKQLEEISKKTALSADQMQEAESILRKMQFFGSDQWANLDKTAGKLHLVAGAFDKMTEAQKKSAAEDIKNKIGKLKKQRTSLRSQNAEYNNKLNLGLNNDYFNQVIENNKALENIEDELRELYARQRELAKGSKKGVTGKVPTSSTAKNVEEHKREKAAKAEEVTQAEKDLAKLEADAAKNNRTNLQQEIFEIDEKRKALEKYIETLKKGENADIDAIEKRKKAMEEALNAEESQARQKAAEEDAKILEELDEANKRDKEEKAKKAFEKMFNKKLENKDFDTLLPALDKMLSGQRTALAEAEKMIREAVAWEPADKFSQEQKAKQIAEYQKIAEEARAKKNEIESKIEQAKDAQEQALKTDSQQGLKTQGSWSLKNLSMALGGGTAAEQIAYNTKESVKLQKKTNKALDEIKKNNSMTFGA